MYQKLVVLIVIALFSLSLRGQTPINIMTVDQSTYKLWQEKNWKQLLTEGNEAVEHGIDFYFLRVRMGIASYERKNYHRAIQHFEKAREFNNQEEYVTEYLYYAYLFGGRPEEAKKLASTFSETMKAATSTLRKPFIRELQLYYSTDMSSNPTTTANYQMPTETMVAGAQYVANNHHIFHLGLTHDIGGSFSLHHGYTYINQHYFLFRQNDTLRLMNPEYITNSHQYFITGQIRLARNWNLGVGMHYIMIRFPLEQMRPGMGPGAQRSSVGKDQDFSLFIHLKKHFPYLTAGGSFYYSTLSNDKQIQVDLKLSAYPLGNTNLYTNTIVSWQQETSSGTPVKRILLNQEIGGKLGNHLWIEGFGTFGNISNYLSDDGQVVFNEGNLISLRAGTRLIIPINNKISFRLEYAFSKHKSVFYPNNFEDVTYNPIFYNIHSITGGLIWNLSKPARY